MLSVNPLSNPKGVRLLCELCQAPAFLLCPDCRVTYYCSTEHQRSDFESVHPQLCSLLVRLRAPKPALCSETERQRSAEKCLQIRRHLLDICQQAAERLLVSGRYSQAQPAAMHALRFGIVVHGLRSLQLVPAYLLLAETATGMGVYSQAEEYLSHADWTVLKNPDCSPTLLAKLHRIHGTLLFFSKGNMTEALRHFANDIYYSSCAYGAGDIRTAPGYFHMANIFLRQRKEDVADSFYAEVTEIWHAHLSKMLQGRLQNSRETEGAEEDCIEEPQAAEAVKMLTEIWEVRERVLKQDSAKGARNLHALAMLHFLLSDVSKAYEVALKALLIAKEIPNQDEVQAITTFLTLAESKLPVCK
ncbi:zinc finger MYND domain-containing protein 12 [Lissotriton helveticus]